MRQILQNALPLVRHLTPCLTAKAWHARITIAVRPIVAKLAFCKIMETSGGRMSRQRIICCSEAPGPDSHGIFRVLDAPESNNSAVSITGVLLFNAGYVLHLLEGRRASVTQAFYRITEDSRHKSAEPVSASATSIRRFGDWRTNNVSARGHVGHLLRTYQVDTTFNPACVN